MSDKEPIYDAEIAPLMAQIIVVCKREGIPFAATFQLNDGDEEDDGPLWCTSALAPIGCDPKIHRLFDMMKREPVGMLAITVTGGEGQQ